MAESIRFLLDQHIPVAVAQGLRQRGVEVLTLREAGRCGLPDGEQLAFAAQHCMVLVSHDRDFLVLDAAGTRHAGVAWCQAAKYSVRQLIHALLLVHSVLRPEDMVNHVEYL